MRISDPDHLLFDYTRVMMGFRLFRPKPKRIEMIGLGGGSLAKACYRCLPDCDITVVEMIRRLSPCGRNSKSRRTTVGFA